MRNHLAPLLLLLVGCATAAPELGGDLRPPEKQFVEQMSVDTNTLARRALAPVIAMLGKGTRFEDLPLWASVTGSGAVVKIERSLPR